ncbi:hypothetical protein NDU88_000433 [Pleurodeles waltl]|uniref:Secreted protein n=1 Tax=Pleurodeles waltl TaxID=8319 RepID=A0AAV7TH92_PLEWA|nr:hypothetical protein NDU88_000433 [Pleurodeles waltl]
MTHKLTLELGRCAWVILVLGSSFVSVADCLALGAFSGVRGEEGEQPALGSRSGSAALSRTPESTPAVWALFGYRATGPQGSWSGDICICICGRLQLTGGADRGRRRWLGAAGLLRGSNRPQIHAGIGCQRGGLPSSGGALQCFAERSEVAGSGD